MIRIEAVWLAVGSLDMRAGTDTIIARIVAVFGQARAHHAYLFANRRANRMKVLVHDGIGLWLAARRLNRGHFVRSDSPQPNQAISASQLTALVLGLPWRGVGDIGAITLT